MRPVRVLILYTTYGEGHRQAAKAIDEAFSLIDSGAEVILCDLLSESLPLWNGLTKYIYESMFTIGRNWYSYWYYKTKEAKSFIPYLEMISLPGLSSLQKLIHKVQPDLIISTFPTLSRMASILRAKQKCAAPVWTIITDFDFHGNWYHPACDRYFVACDSVKQDLIQSGCLPNQIVISGIPIRRMFEEAQAPNTPDRDGSFRVLVTAGALGVLSGSSSLVEDLCRVGTKENEITVDLVCGRNERMLQRAQQLKQEYPNLNVYGYVERMDVLMRSASLLITKAGGLTVSEAIALYLPMILYRSLPGQELENAKFLEMSGAAVIAGMSDEVVSILRQLATDNAKLVAMRQAAFGLRKANAAHCIASEAIEYHSKITLESVT
ncbi:MAG: hypothetical protein JWN30_2786 [Bacilli bacterium]|nr:hypothetical protein [Bacilli bacterium]